jgi:hypothetical protein
MANQNASTGVTRRQMIKGVGIAIAGVGGGAFAPALIGPSMRLGIPPAHAAGPVKLPIGFAVAIELEHALGEAAALGAMVSLAWLNGHIMARTGLQLMAEGFAAESVMVRVTHFGAGFAITTLSMFKIAFFISSAGLVVWVMIQERWAPHVGEIDIEFVPDDQWWAAYPNGDMSGMYMPVTPHDLQQAWSDMTQYLYQHPQFCSGFNAKPGQGGCFGAFGGGPGGPFESPTPPEGWIGVGPIIEVQ